MAIDDPIEQALARVEADARDQNPFLDALESVHPFVRAIAVGLKAFQIGDATSFFETFKDISEAFSRERSKYLLGVVINEVKALWERYDRLDTQHQRYLNTDWLELFVDAEQKARASRGKERVLRIAKIISGAAYVTPAEPAHATEEMTRIAVSLDDRDILMLKLIVERQGKMIKPGTERVDFYPAYSTWPTVAADARKCGISHGELDAICGKLESFGLISRGERNTNVHGSDPVPFALLLRGRKFLEQVQFSADAMATGS